MGYLYQPEQTKATIRADGFMYTGDVAEFDDCNDPSLGGYKGIGISSRIMLVRNLCVVNAGFIRITGRAKELIITAGAENIAPLSIEKNMKNAMSALSNCLVIGDGRKYLTMLISLKCEVDLHSNIPTDNLAPAALHIGKEIGSAARTMSEAAQDPEWKKYIDAGMKAANTKSGSCNVMS